jgi:hypothetical protein
MKTMLERIEALESRLDKLEIGGDPALKASRKKKSAPAPEAVTEVESVESVDESA